MYFISTNYGAQHRIVILYVQLILEQANTLPSAHYSQVFSVRSLFWLFLCFIYVPPPPPPMAQQPPVGRGLLIFKASRSHSDKPHSVGLLWTRNRPVAQTYTWKHTTIATDIHAPGGNRNRNPIKRAVAHPSLRLRGHWDRHYYYYYSFILLFSDCGLICFLVFFPPFFECSVFVRLCCIVFLCWLCNWNLYFWACILINT